MELLIKKNLNTFFVEQKTPTAFLWYFWNKKPLLLVKSHNCVIGKTKQRFFSETKKLQKKYFCTDKKITTGINWAWQIILHKLSFYSLQIHETNTAFTLKTIFFSSRTCTFCFIYLSLFCFLRSVLLFTPSRKTERHSIIYQLFELIYTNVSKWDNSFNVMNTRQNWIKAFLYRYKYI